MKKTAALGLGASLLGASLMGAGSAFAADYKDSAVPVAAGATAEGAAAWTPSIATNVLGAKLQDGPNADDGIGGLGVWPGQSAKYEILVDRDAPVFTDASGDEREILGFSVSDQLPAGVTADVKTLSVFDPAAGENGANLVAGADYTLAVSEDNVLTIDFSDNWIGNNVGPDKAARLSVVFTITLAEDAPAYSAPSNAASQTITLAGVDQAGELLPPVVAPEVPVDPEAAPVEPVEPEQPADNYTFTAENPASILVPGVTPVEAVLSAVDRTPVEDRVVVGGDALVQTVKLDGTFGEDTEDGAPVALESAYDVTRFGIVEDYDESLVTIDPDSVRVTNPAGTDVTDRFTVTDAAGVLSVLALTDEATGAVNPEWLVRDYAVEFTVVVRSDVKEDAGLTSVTTEVVNEAIHPVENESAVAVKAVAPVQTAVAANGSRDALGTVPSQGEFFYRTVSSAHPANALYPVASWAAGAALTAGDQQLHDVWSVRAVGDILAADGVTVAFADGAVIAANDTRAEWFKLRPNGDSVVLEATPAFTAAVSASAGTPAQWELFTSNTRIAAEGTRTSNTGQEYRNNVERLATVTTATGAVGSANLPVDAAPVVVPPAVPVPGDGGTGAGQDGVVDGGTAAVVPAGDALAAVPAGNAATGVLDEKPAAASLANTGTDSGANKVLAIGAATLLAAGGAALMILRRKSAAE